MREKSFDLNRIPGPYRESLGNLIEDQDLDPEVLNHLAELQPSRPEESSKHWEDSLIRIDGVYTLRNPAQLKTLSIFKIHNILALFFELELDDSDNPEIQRSKNIQQTILAVCKVSEEERSRWKEAWNIAANSVSFFNKAEASLETEIPIGADAVLKRVRDEEILVYKQTGLELEQNVRDLLLESYPDRKDGLSEDQEI